MSGIDADAPSQPGQPGQPGQEAPQATRSLFDPRKAARQVGGPIESRPIRKRTAILIGINDYIDQSIAALNYCVKDVKTMEAVLEQHGYVVHALHDDNAMGRKPIRSNVVTVLEAVCSTLGAADMLLVHVSCHGVLVDGKQCFLLMQDTRRSQVQTQGLALSVLSEIMNTCKARQRVLFLDACHSGIEGGRSVSEQTKAAEAAFNRRVHEMAEGFALLSSSTSGQLSHEWNEKEHGLFTYFVLAGLGGKAARSAHRFVTFDDIKEYVQKELLRWNERYPERPIQQPTAKTQVIGDIILADLPEQAPVSAIPSPGLSASSISLPSGAERQEAHSATSLGARPASGYVRAAELAVICGCDRDPQWSDWARLVQSRGDWLFLLPGPKGEGHDLFVRRLLEEIRRAFPAKPAPRALAISWRRRLCPPMAEQDYRQALAAALHASSAEEPQLLEALRRQREQSQLLLVHPVLDSGHSDPALRSYYREWLPSLLEKSKSPKTLGVKVVQPIEWWPAGWILRQLAPLLRALWPRPSDALRQALSWRESQRLTKDLKRRWSGGLQLAELPPLQRISKAELYTFLRSQDISDELQKDLLKRLAPLDREAEQLLRDLMKKLPEYKESSYGRI